MASEIAQENQAIKRQKLDGGRSRQVPVSFKCEEHSFRFWSLMVHYNQILNVKTRVLPHKSKPDSAGGTDIFASSLRGYHEDLLARKVCAYLICMDYNRERLFTWIHAHSSVSSGTGANTIRIDCRDG